MSNSSEKSIKPNNHFAAQSHIDWKGYQTQYQRSIQDPEAYWAEQAERLTWFKKWDQVKNVNFTSPVHIEWYRGGQLNVSMNCLDRHLPHHSQRTAFLFEPDDPQRPTRRITYNEAFNEVNLMANVLKHHGVKKGDCVTIYMPMIPEAIYAMLACARIGAVHSVIFGGFSPDAITDRIKDGDSSFVITADEGVRGGKIIHLKKNLDESLKHCPQVKKVLVIRHTQAPLSYTKGRDYFWDKEKLNVSTFCEPEIMDAEDPLFLLYTSGSTNKPKGVLHTTGGYLVYASLTHQIVFDYKPDDIYWCTADVGWITGHSYIVYGPMSNGATSVIYEGVPHFPTSSRLWEIIDKHKVSIFYTAPTALRALMREGDKPVQRTHRRSLRLLGTVGEPINPEAWNWYYTIVGKETCPIVDTWWQTETGGILISPLPGATPLKPGSATLPFFGIQPQVLTPEGQTLAPLGACEGVLVLKDSWPGQMRTVYKDHARFEQTYFSQYPGYYFTGDGCRRDEDGYYWITGRVDDVLNVAGHRLGTAEIESALVAHSSVAEAAVVGYPHDIKGQGIYCFVTLKDSIQSTLGDAAQIRALRAELIQWVRNEISPIATPDQIQFAPALPKTRSGKIMRRILRKIAEGQFETLGDTSTLADPTVVQDLIANKLNT